MAGDVDARQKLGGKNNEMVAKSNDLVREAKNVAIGIWNSLIDANYDHHDNNSCPVSSIGSYNQIVESAARH
jgi:hypothetical protein